MIRGGSLIDWEKAGIIPKIRQGKVIEDDWYNCCNSFCLLNPQLFSLVYFHMVLYVSRTQNYKESGRRMNIGTTLLFLIHSDPDQTRALNYLLLLETLQLDLDSPFLCGVLFAFILDDIFFVHS